MKRLACIAALALLGGTLAAQEAPKTNLTELTAPSNPALTLMGVQPSEVTRPKSLNQLESTLINEFTAPGSGLVIPNDFGLEVMPYWLRSRPEVKFDAEALKKNQSRPLQNLGASIGSVNQTVNDTVRSQIGFGLRTQLFSGKLTGKQVDTLNMYSVQYQAYAAKQSRIDNALFQVENTQASTYRELFDEVKAKLEFMASSNPNVDAETEVARWTAFFRQQTQGHAMTDPLAAGEAQALVKQMRNAISEAMNADEVAQMGQKVKDLRTARYGFIWEVAAATFLDFPTGTIEFSTVPKLGAWTTATYRLPNQRFDFLGTVRYIEDFSIEKRTSNIDFGGRIVFNTGKLSLSGEYLQRYQQRVVERTLAEDGRDLKTTLSGYDYRATLNASYRISNAVVINYSFGKRFDFSDAAVNNLVSQLSVNFGFGSVPLSLRPSGQ